MRPIAEGFGHQELDHVKWRAKAGIVGLVIGAAVVTFIALPPTRLLHILEEQISAALEAIKSHGLTGLLVVLASGLIIYGLRRAWSRARAGAAPASRVVPVHAPRLRVHRAGVAEGGKQLERPSFLPERYADAAKSDQEAEMPHGTGPSAQSAAGFLMRFRRSFTLGENEAEAVTQARPVRRLARPPCFRLVADIAESLASAATPTPRGGDATVLKPNDLRDDLNQRLASKDNNDSRKVHVLAPEPRCDKTDPALNSLDTVLNHVFAAGRGGAPRALLVGSGWAGVDATAEAVSIARALAARSDQVVLVDLACGPISVSGALGLPPSLGLADLSAGRAGFEDIVRIDAETPLQVIAAGNPKLTASGEGSERITSIFEALTQAYDGVVLHTDHEALLKFTSALRFELSAVIAVVDAAAGAGGAKIDLSEFSALGCPVLVYEQSGKERRSRSLAAPVSLAAASNE